ncbi:MULTISPECIES: hypothetical protein [unclassified Streptomyces]|uniref:hypothetical protein n=1 Tax=unclassified Streptomyces TaxID=2593676 RepID=UPI00225659E6|nr:hypothetical protein [Streptomyces sp. NBC_00893]MCX4851851.1 hypothetical protein [Streptomyces sp. NBC_00893]
MHDQFSDLGVYETNVLDSSNLNAKATTDSILERLARGAYLLGPEDSATDADNPIHNF